MIEDPLLIDFMLDIANVGGPSKRRGWRIYYTTEGHFQFKDDPETKKPTGKVDVLKTWQAIEKLSCLPTSLTHDCVPKDAALQETFEADKLNQLLGK